MGWQNLNCRDVNRSIPSPDVVDIWVCYLSEVRRWNLVQPFWDLLSKNEKEKYSRFRFAADRFRYLVTRALVRTTLSRYGPQTPHEWQFCQNQHGKPMLSPCISDSFKGHDWNVSHSGDLVVVAVAAVRSIGVDVENIHVQTELSATAALTFAPEELDAFMRSGSGDRRELFFAHWTLKEAYTKARGMGISIPLQSASFMLDIAGTINFVSTESAQRTDDWSFWQVRPDDDHILAICAGGGRPLPTLRFYRTVPNVDAKPWDLVIVRQG
ncbi:4'-phosphopantetheinyl transferase family protein [Sinorhizobium meliloti]|uniref:4'-phosphopantetheinyl transferase family protein n=1 Tax=Rhizobium meliloti TaxID=382 RepID=UPI0012FE6B63|nr:4'-phosphopantetheinyl transferase superfamily protein [Sinorhizobium meliloti]MDE3856963.1 4'-phosphopantetheinyl transferase superfamily protein [Sinorhizobium meliloti]